MKSIVLSRGDNQHDRAEGLWLQTKPSGDVEIASDGCLYHPNGLKKAHNNVIIGVIPKSEIGSVIEFLKQNS